ncbi:MAG: hypothetical protein WC637_14135 [Victivallales bacterium]|jgi:hypothetical protein
MKDMGNTSVSCMKAVCSGWDRMEKTLFHPFDLGKWFLLGFSAWLANLGQGFGAHFNLPSMPQKGAFPLENISTALIILICCVAGAVFIVCLALSLVMLWIRSRGDFIFLDNLVHAKTAVLEPWRKYSGRGNSLFMFRIACWIFFIGFLLITLCSSLLMCWHSIRSKEMDPFCIAGIVFAALCLFTFIMTVVFFELSLKSFIVPIMFRRQTGACGASLEFLKLFSANPMAFVRYYLMYMLLSLCASVAVVIFIFSTCCLCCIGLILLCLPYLWAVVMLPILTFFRFYSIEFLAQFGDDYNVYATGT